MKILFSFFLCIVIIALGTPHNQAMHLNRSASMSTNKMITLGAIGGATLYYFYSKKYAKIMEEGFSKQVKKLGEEKKSKKACVWKIRKGSQNNKDF